jgi:hypothetical protein
MHAFLSPFAVGNKCGSVGHLFFPFLSPPAAAETNTSYKMCDKYCCMTKIGCQMISAAVASAASATGNRAKN